MVECGLGEGHGWVMIYTQTYTQTGTVQKIYINTQQDCIYNDNGFVTTVSKIVKRRQGLYTTHTSVMCSGVGLEVTQNIYSSVHQSLNC